MGMMEDSRFRQAEKVYKRGKVSEFSEVFDFHHLGCNNGENHERILNVTDEFLKKWRLSGHQTEMKVFRIDGKPGFLMIINAFTPREQKYWIRKCVLDYTDGRYPSNLTGRNEMMLSPPSTLLKLRWITLGYHYNWTCKTYQKDDGSPFPIELNDLATSLMTLFTSYKGFIPEASIINYYQLKDSLMGHRDISEEMLEAPLLSISFGQSAIFLLGGKSKEEKPIAIRVYNGDIIIMEKEARISYHGVPRILENTLPMNLKEITVEDDKNWIEIKKYLETSRININIRQLWKT
jgi:alkylated DNA repair protein alkB family protein 1